jgi:hypothetical protein
VARWAWPFVAALVGALLLLLVVYVPAVWLWLPRVLGVR